MKISVASGATIAAVALALAGTAPAAAKHKHHHHHKAGHHKMSCGGKNNCPQKAGAAAPAAEPAAPAK